MKPARKNYEFYAGATFDELIRLRDGTGSPLNLTGCLLLFQAFSVQAVPEKLIELSLQNGGVLMPDPLTGSFRLYLSEQATLAPWKAAVAEYGLSMKSPTGRVRPLLYGEIVRHRGGVRWPT